MADTKLVIIGGGPSATALLKVLSILGASASMAVTVVERRAECALGFPYSPDNALPQHTLGRSGTSRLRQGRKLQRIWTQAWERLQAQGVTLNLLLNSTVVDLKGVDGFWRATLDNGVVLEATHVVLAMGHWDVPSRFKDHPGWFDSPWPVTALTSMVPRGEPVALLGTFQTALDAAITLARHNGSFSKTPDKRVRYRLNSKSQGFRLTLCSRGGFFPQVSAPTPSRRGQNTYVTLEMVERLRSEHRGFVPLDALYTHLWQDFRRASACGAIQKAFPGVQGVDFNADMLWIKRALERRDGVGMLQRSLSQARAEGARMAWGDVLWGSVDVVYALFPHLCGEDRLRLEPFWTTIFGFVEAINGLLASRIAALVDAGIVEVVRLGRAPKITALEDSTFVLEGDCGSVRARRVVDCRGQNPSIQNGSDPLLRALQERGLVQPALIPFRGDPSGAGFGNHSAVCVRGGRYFYRAGGVFVDPSSYRVIAPPHTAVTDATSTLFATGPLTIGQFPLYVGLLGTRIAAARIAECVLGRV